MIDMEFLRLTLTENDEIIFTTEIPSHFSSVALVAGVYQNLWNPKSNNIKKSSDLCVCLRFGIIRCIADHFKCTNLVTPTEFYQFVRTLTDLLEICSNHGECSVDSSIDKFYV